MNNPLKKLYCIALACSFLFFSNLANAAPQTIQIENKRCPQKGIALAFMNGVGNTIAQAASSQVQLEYIHGRQTSKNETITYFMLYNTTHGLLEDLAETYEQRLHEVLLSGRYEYFFPMVHGGTGSLLLDRGLQVLLDPPLPFRELVESEVRVRTIAALNELRLKGRHLQPSAPTELDYANHRAMLDLWMSEGKKILLVAHSQGNLFANVAYRYLWSKADRTKPVLIRVVHIAPASVTVNGDHTLADLDLVINGLRSFGYVPPITDGIPIPFARPPGTNGAKDFKGHGFQEIYLNPGLKISNSVKMQINTALNAITSPAKLTVLANPGDMGGDSSSIILDECPRSTPPPLISNP